MPYIKASDRARLNNGINWNAMKPGNAGELNFVVSQIVADYCLRKGLKYAVIAEVQAALEGSLSEFNRRIAGPYEDAKIEENGDLAMYERLLKEAGL